LTAGAVIDGGDGTDTISASLLGSSVAGLIKNFETVDAKGVSGTYDMSMYTASSFNGVALSGALGGATSVTNLAGTALNVNVTVGSASTSLGALTAKLASSTGTADTANISFAPTRLTANTGSTFSDVITTGIETVNVSSSATQATATGAFTAKGVITKLTDQSNTTSSIVVTGANDFTLGAYTNAGTSTSGFAQNTVTTTAVANSVGALTMIDASASTGVQVIVAGSDDALNGGSTYYNKYTGLTIKGGSKGDTLVNKAISGDVDGGAGDDTIVISGKSASAIGGAGADTVYASGSTQSVDVGVDTKVDSVVIGTDAEFTSTFVSGTSSVTTISNLAKADTLNLAAYLSAGATADIEKWTASASSLDGAVAAAWADTTDAIDWFNWGTDTYIVVDGASNDAVIKLVGTYTLSTATAASGVVTLG
jgi:hypothetical protein